MYLTVETALESLSAECDTMRRMAAADAQNELVAQFDELTTTLNGIGSVLTDLNTCAESLALNGYTEEWFAIVNEGNRFVAITNLELPKFFGTAETKKVACENAVWQTAKIWLAKAWEIVKKLFEVVMEGVRQLLRYWGRPKENTSAVTKVLSALQDKCREVNQMPLITIPNIVTIEKYAKRLADILDSFVSVRDNHNGEKFYESICSDHGTNSTTLDVYTRIVDIFQARGIRPDMPAVNGFSISNSGISFVDLKKLDTIALDVSDDKNNASIIAASKSLDKLFSQMYVLSTTLIGELGRNRTGLYDDYLYAKNNFNNDPSIVRPIQLKIERCKEYLKFVRATVAQQHILKAEFKRVLFMLQDKANELGIKVKFTI